MLKLDSVAGLGDGCVDIMRAWFTRKNGCRGEGWPDMDVTGRDTTAGMAQGQGSRKSYDAFISTIHALPESFSRAIALWSGADAAGAVALAMVLAW